MCAYPCPISNSGSKGVFRVSVGPHNDEHDCVMLVEGLWKAMEKLSQDPNCR